MLMAVAMFLTTAQMPFYDMCMANYEMNVPAERRDFARESKVCKQLAVRMAARLSEHTGDDNGGRSQSYGKIYKAYPTE